MRFRRRERAELDELREEVTRWRTEVCRSLDDLRAGFAARDTDLARALGSVAEASHAVAGRIEEDRAERAALVDALSRLAAASLEQSSRSGPPRHHLIGGSVIGGSIDPEIVLPEEGVHHDASADPRHDVLHHESVEVHCRFGDRWVGGFEVAEVVPGDGSALYRLRRRSDGSVLPSLFDERDVRFRVSFADR